MTALFVVSRTYQLFICHTSCAQVFRPRTPPEAIELVSRLLEYTPSSRISPMEACAHSFFNELRQPAVRMPNGRELPSLFNFTQQGKQCALFGDLEACLFWCALYRNKMIGV